jgi:PhnB protein
MARNSGKGANMAAVNTYINFDGNCAEAFDFYKSVLGGEFQMKTRFGDMPEMPAPPEMKDRLMHVALPIGNTVLMGSDWSPQFGPMVRGNSFAISLLVDTKAEADRFFKGLSAGGKVTMPLALVPWGAYFGMFTDKFGINWMVNQQTEKA